MKTINKSVLKHLSQIKPEFNFLHSSNFVAEGLLDSFDVVHLVTILDTEYNISIDGIDIVPENFSTIASISKLLIKNGVLECT
ncbi:acyl carrier protein [Winogradskyella sp.]|uniref:acyl carrier protein n=1 Tax=uncultured Winogradskyella sp. TaxID=395353 RepID=UPI002373C938|nr:acyl carrier protein [Winogradskyella sp.]|tara:strand:- start:6864 stop:7112 length:249 start_codon:yes stop_codon:yes gene_type:complete